MPSDYQAGSPGDRVESGRKTGKVGEILTVYDVELLFEQGGQNTPGEAERFPNGASTIYEERLGGANAPQPDILVEHDVLTLPVFHAEDGDLVSLAC
jgi:hypothetical protein